jgi:hypothetical protein
MAENQPPTPARVRERWMPFCFLAGLLLLIWLTDWAGPYGPLEFREWCRRNFWPDKHEHLYIIIAAPAWSFGEVRSCQRVSDPGETLRNRGFTAKELLDCAGWFTKDEYVSHERWAVTYKEKGYDAQTWDCLKTPQGLILPLTKPAG